MQYLSMEMYGCPVHLENWYSLVQNWCSHLKVEIPEEFPQVDFVAQVLGAGLSKKVRVCSIHLITRSIENHDES